ncbi:hypothetical protein K502DRAFT_325558, partial [Neoconidiobolus thromboides FSU 785]
MTLTTRQASLKEKVGKGKEWISIGNKKLQYSGYLMKLGKNLCWQRRLFKFDGETLYCYKTQRSINSPANNPYVTSATLLNPTPHKYLIIKWKVKIEDIVDIQLIKDKVKENDAWFMAKSSKAFVLTLSNGENLILRSNNKMDLDRWLFTLSSHWPLYKYQNGTNSNQHSFREACIQAWNQSSLLVQAGPSSPSIQINDNEMVCSLLPPIKVPFKQVELVSDTKPDVGDANIKNNHIKNSININNNLSNNGSSSSINTINSNKMNKINPISSLKPRGLINVKPTVPKHKHSHSNSNPQLQSQTNLTLNSNGNNIATAKLSRQKHRRNQSDVTLELPRYKPTKPTQQVPYIDIIESKQRATNKDKFPITPSQHNNVNMKKLNKPLVQQTRPNLHLRSLSNESVGYPTLKPKTNLYGSSQVRLNEQKRFNKLKYDTNNYLPPIHPIGHTKVGFYPTPGVKNAKAYL